MGGEHLSRDETVCQGRAREGGGSSLVCLQRSRCVWKIQNTPDPVERRPLEYISIAMGGSESARGSSLAFSKQDRKCRHNP